MLAQSSGLFRYGKRTGKQQRQGAKVAELSTSLTIAPLFVAFSRVLWSMSPPHCMLLLPVSQRGLYCPLLLRAHWPFSSSTICFAKRAWATLVLGQGKTVTGLRDLLHTETFQGLGQLDVVSPAGFLLIWSIQTLLCV